jgi:hypothetical protein
MMGLYLLDRQHLVKNMIHPAKDWTEQEEQRRVFWMAFLLDRFAASNYRCPMIIDDKDVILIPPLVLVTALLTYGGIGSYSSSSNRQGVPGVYRNKKYQPPAST